MYSDTGSRTPACQRLFSRHVCTKEAGCVPYTMSDVLLRLVRVYVHINLNVLYFVQHKISRGIDILTSGKHQKYVEKTYA
jgi:hypothetical protein